MQRSLLALLAVATLSAGAQAPIVRANPSVQPDAGYAAPNPSATQNQIANSQPIAGVLLRTQPGAAVQTIAADAQGTHLRIDRGRVNVNVHHPASKAEILVDLPGGQTALLKDGLYTFNADTNTVRVLKGEAEAFPPASTSGRGIKIKEEQELTFAAGNLRSQDSDRRQLFADLLPNADGTRGGSSANGYRGDGPYRYNSYRYHYPAYGYGYPAYGYGYPAWSYGFFYGLGRGLR